MNAPLRSFVLAATLLCAAASPASARLLEYSVDGHFVVSGPYSWGPFGARFTTVFDSSADPIETTETSATFEALYATVTYLGGERDGETEFVYGVTLRIAADADFGVYGYTFTGVSEAGWQVWNVEWASDPAFVPDFDLPTTDPLLLLTDPTASYGGDVSIIARAEGWSAFTDNGAFFDVSVLRPRPGAPVILRQPSLGHGKPGRALKLEVKVRSRSPVSYQWLKDGLPLPGETSSKLTVRTLTDDDAGVYRVLVRNQVGIVISRPVTVGTRCLPPRHSPQGRH